MPAVCYYHSSLPAIGICSRCGRSICSSCYKPYLELAFCPDCYHRRVPPPTSNATVLPPQNVVSTRPPVLFGPWPVLRPLFPINYAWVPAVLFFTSAALILFNAIALLVPSFFAIWAGVFPWVAMLGALAFILGIILGLVVVGGFILFLLGFRVFAVFLVFPAAILSLLIGGGFLAGLLIGVIACLLVITNRTHYL